jgi:hypothetical protein
MNLENVISECNRQNLEITKVYRNDDEGSHAIVFIKNKLYADIECYDSGIALAVVSDKNDRPDVWTVEDLPSTIIKIKDFFESV